MRREEEMAEYGAGAGAGASMTEEQISEVLHCVDVCRSSTQFLEIRADQNWGAAEDRVRWVRKSLEMWRIGGESKEERDLWSYQLESQLRREKVFYMRGLLAAGVKEEELQGAWSELLKEAIEQSKVSLETELFHKRREYLKAEGGKELKLREVLIEAKAAKERLELNLSCPYMRTELELMSDEVEQSKSYFLREVNATVRAMTMEMKSLLEVQKQRLSEVLGGRLEELVEVESKRLKTGEAEEKSKEKAEAEKKAEKK